MWARARKRARATKKRASSTDTGTASKRPKNMPGMTRQMSQMYATEFNIPREVARNILAENPQLRKPGQLESLRDLGSLGKTMFTKSFVAKPSVVPPVGEPSAERHHSSEEETDSSESSAEESSEEEESESERGDDDDSPWDLRTIESFTIASRKLESEDYTELWLYDL